MVASKRSPGSFRSGLIGIERQSRNPVSMPLLAELGRNPEGFPSPFSQLPPVQVLSSPHPKNPCSPPPKPTDFRHQTLYASITHLPPRFLFVRTHCFASNGSRR